MEKRLKKYLVNGKFQNVTANTVNVMASIRGKNNKSTEIRLRMALVRSGLKDWKLNYKGLPGKPDIFFLYAHVAVFVDGCFWHGCPKCGHIPKTRSEFWAAKIKGNRIRDKKIKMQLEMLGISAIRIWEHELVNKRKIAMAINRIEKVIKKNG